MMVDMNEILKIAKEVITEEIEKEGLRVLNFFIFGSRARGDFKPDSDWDFLVVIDKEINRDTKWNIILKVKRKLQEFKISLALYTKLCYFMCTILKEDKRRDV